MERPRLSYIMTTYNKVSYLRITLPLLIAAKKADEEIVIVDGGSTDGTKEYLQQLLDEKKIDQFESAKDFGEAHGTNKAMLLARGELLKIITDDDVFDYDAIHSCRNFMLSRNDVDILGFDGYSCNMNLRSQFNPSNFIAGFKKWQADKTPFLFCGLSFLIRRSSLPYLGLFNTQFIIVDMEYSIRVSSLRSRIAFYTGLGFVNIVNPNSNSKKFYDTIRLEKDRLMKWYPSVSDNFRISNILLQAKDKLAALKKKKEEAPAPTNFDDYEKLVKQGIEKLRAHNLATSLEVLA